MKLRFACSPQLRPLLPEPVLAAKEPQPWLSQMPNFGGGDYRNPTAKRCPPFVDAVRIGVYLRLTADIWFDGTSFSWREEDATELATPYLSGPMSYHHPTQLTGTPLAGDATRIIKFHNYWTVAADPGWSVLFMHPTHRFDLPFRVVSGVVDVDRYPDVPVQIPAIWTSQSSCRLEKGTVIAQCFAFKREAISLEITSMNEAQSTWSNVRAEEILTKPHVYRRRSKARATDPKVV